MIQSRIQSRRIQFHFIYDAEHRIQSAVHRPDVSRPDVSRAPYPDPSQRPCQASPLPPRQAEACQSRGYAAGDGSRGLPTGTGVARSPPRSAPLAIRAYRSLCIRCLPRRVRPDARVPSASPGASPGVPCQTLPDVRPSDSTPRPLRGPFDDRTSSE